MINKTSITKMCRAYEKKHGKAPNTVKVNIAEYQALTKLYDLVLLRSGPATFAQREDNSIHFIVDRDIKKASVSFDKDRKDMTGTTIVRRKGLL